MRWRSERKAAEAAAAPEEPRSRFLLPLAGGSGLAPAEGAAPSPPAPVAPPQPGPPSEAAAPAAGPATAPPGAAPPEAAPPVMQHLATKVASLVNNLEQDRGALRDVSTKMSQMEDRIRGITNVSEALNMQMNPFLPEPAPAPAGPPWAAAAGAAPGAGFAAVPPPPGGYAGPGAGAGAGFAYDPQVLAATPGFQPSPPSLAPPVSVAGTAAVARPSLAADLPRWVVMMHWVDFLLDQVGSQGIVELVGFYEKAGWVDGETAAQLLHYLEGIARGAEVPASKPPSAPKELLALHLRSLRFLQLMEGAAPEATEMARLFREMARIRDGA